MCHPLLEPILQTFDEQDSLVGPLVRQQAARMPLDFRSEMELETWLRQNVPVALPAELQRDLRDNLRFIGVDRLNS